MGRVGEPRQGAPFGSPTVRPFPGSVEGNRRTTRFDSLSERAGSETAAASGSHPRGPAAGAKCRGVGIELRRRARSVSSRPDSRPLERSISSGMRHTPAMTKTDVTRSAYAVSTVMRSVWVAPSPGHKDERVNTSALARAVDQRSASSGRTSVARNSTSRSRSGSSVVGWKATVVAPAATKRRTASAIASALPPAAPLPSCSVSRH